MVSKKVILIVIVIVVILLLAGLGLGLFFLLRPSDQNPTGNTNGNTGGTTNPSASISSLLKTQTVGANLATTRHSGISQYFTYPAYYASGTLPVPAAIPIQITLRGLDGSHQAIIGSELPYNNQVDNAYYYQDTTYLNLYYPASGRDGGLLPNGYISEAGLTKYSASLRSITIGNLVKALTVAMGSQFTSVDLEGSAGQQFYLYQRYVMSSNLTLPSGDLANIIYDLNGRLYAPGQEINGDTANLYYYRNNLTANSLEIIIPTYWSGLNRVNNGLVNGTSLTGNITVYTYPNKATYRHVSLDTATAQTMTATKYKLYATYWLLSYTINPSGLHNILGFYSFNNVKYSLLAANISQHSLTKFAGFYYEVVGNTLNILVPQCNVYSRDKQNLLVNDNGSVSDHFELLYYG